MSLEQIPEDRRGAFMHVCQELANITDKWQLYLDLFGEEENHALLHDTAGHAFNAIEESLRVDITMSICRLADPVASCGEANLSFKGMETLFPTNTGFKEEVERFRNHCGPLKTLRNKLVAHNDLKTRIDPENNLLPGVAKPDIERILGSAVKALNIVAGEYADTELDFKSPAHLDGMCLLYWLEKGWQTLQEEE